MTTSPTDLALAQTPTENASETPRLRETQTPDTTTGGVCCQQRSCSALDFAGDVEERGFGGFRFSISHGKDESVATLDLCGATRRKVSSNDLILLSMMCLKTAAKINGLL